VKIKNLLSNNVSMNELKTSKKNLQPPIVGSLKSLVLILASVTVLVQVLMELRLANKVALVMKLVAFLLTASFLDRSVVLENMTVGK